MKPRNHSALNLSVRPSKWLGLCTLSLSFFAAGSAMAQTWDGGGANTNWSTGLNWVLDTAPASGTLTFAGSTQTTTNNDLAAGTTFNGINFTNNGQSSTGQFALGGNSITLGGNIVSSSIAAAVTGPPAIAAGVPLTDAISLGLILSGDRTVTTNANHSLGISGEISQTGGSRSLIKGGSSPSGTLTLSGNNTYTGITVIQTGTLTVSKIADTAPGAESNLGFGNSIRFAFGGASSTLNYTGSGNTTSRTIQLGDSGAGQLAGTGGASISANGTNGGTGLVFSASNFTISQSSTAASRTLTLLGSNTDANQVTGIIGDVETDVIPANTTATNLTKSNGGRWILAGDNTYTGVSSITLGNLNIRHANALGATIAGTTVSNNGQLELEGSAISFGAEALTLGSGTSGTAMLRNVSGSNTWNGAITATTVVGTANLARIQSEAGTLTLAGGMSGAGADNSFVLQGAGNIDVTGIVSGAIRMNCGSSGAGVRSLSNANTYSGNTTVGGGVLRLNNATAIPGGIATTGGSSNISIGAGILGLGNNDLTRPLGLGIDQIQLTASNAGFAAYGADRSVNLGGASAAVTFGDTGFFFGVTGSPTLVLGAPSATHTLDFQNPIVLAGIRFFRVDNGSATVDARLSGAITGPTTFSKAGAGTLELTNTGNAWTGITFIDSGSLRLGAADVLPSTAVEIKRAAGTDSPPSLDLNGFSETIGGLSLGSLTTDATNVGQTVSIVNSGSGSPVLTLTGTFQYRAGSVGFENGQATISANMNTGASNRNLTIGDGSASVDMLISGVLSGAGNGFNKAGAGVLVISGANTYTGPTAIGTGTLRLGAANTLPDTSAISLNGGMLDVSTFTDTTGTLDANAAGATINLGSGGALAFAASSAIDWTGGTLNITGTFVPGASIRFGTTAAGLTSTQLGLISINGTPGASLDSNGYLIAGSDPYATWSGGASFDGDANNDGVQNGLAWLLGASGPNVSALDKLPLVAVLPGGGLQLTFNMLPSSARGGASLALQHSSDLGISDPWASVLVPDATGGAAPVTFVVSGTNPLSVVGTVASSEAAGGKLFGRLRANR